MAVYLEAERPTGQQGSDHTMMSVNLLIYKYYYYYYYYKSDLTRSFSLPFPLSQRMHFVHAIRLWIPSNTIEYVSSWPLDPLTCLSPTDTSASL